MQRRTIVITGASDGIGAAAARALGRLGHEVVVVGRNREKTAAVAQEIHADHYLVDFSDLDEVRGLAALLLQKYPRIDVLANNAGGIFTPVRQQTAELPGIAQINDSGVRILHSARALRKVAVGK